MIGMNKNIFFLFVVLHALCTKWLNLFAAEDRMDASTRNLRHVRLIEDIRRRIDCVMDAIHRVTTTKGQMRDGVTEVNGMG